MHKNEILKENKATQISIYLKLSPARTACAGTRDLPSVQVHALDLCISMLCASYSTLFECLKSPNDGRKHGGSNSIQHYHSLSPPCPTYKDHLSAGTLVIPWRCSLTSHGDRGSALSSSQLRRSFKAVTNGNQSLFNMTGATVTTGVKQRQHKSTLIRPHGGIQAKYA